MKSSIASRSLKLLGLAAKVGREELAQNLREQFGATTDRLKSRLEQARLIAENLSQLKGAAMKAGQLLSLDAGDYFPPEALEILGKLQGKADPVAWSEVHEVLESELGPERLGDFKQLSEKPAASASIGQVHRALLRTTERETDVAIKIQYPGIRESIDSDLRILQGLAQSFVTVTGRKMDLNEVFDELSLVLHQEADYVRESENMQAFSDRLKGNDDYVVPYPIVSHSTGRVLTMSWEEGLSVGDWLKTRPPRSARERIGRLVLDLYCKEFYDWGLVQTDPNYANFLIRPGDPLQLVILDFGATLRYSEGFRRDYVALLRALATLDRQKIVRAFTEFGLIDERESTDAKETFAEFLLNSLEPFQAARQPFAFNDTDYAKRTRDIGQRFTQSLKYSPPPRKILFLHRKLGGIFTLMKKLEIQLDLRPYWEKMVGQAIGESERS